VGITNISSLRVGIASVIKKNARGLRINPLLWHRFS
jgi:hypothetical protein